MLSKKKVDLHQRTEKTEMNSHENDKKSAGGRPSKSNEHKANQRVSAYFTDDEKKALVRISQEYGFDNPNTLAKVLLRKVLSGKILLWKSLRIMNKNKNLLDKSKYHDKALNNSWEFDIIKKIDFKRVL